MPASLVVRARRDGDRLTVFGHGERVAAAAGCKFLAFGHGERRLKTLLISAKVPRWDRVRLPIVEAAGEIIWVAGLRRSAIAPVTASTRHVIELTLAPRNTIAH